MILHGIFIAWAVAGCQGVAIAPVRSRSGGAAPTAVPIPLTDAERRSEGTASQRPSCGTGPATPPARAGPAAKLLFGQEKEIDNARLCTYTVFILKLTWDPATNALTRQKHGVSFE